MKESWVFTLFKEKPQTHKDIALLNHFNHIFWFCCKTLTFFCTHTSARISISTKLSADFDDAGVKQWKVDFPLWLFSQPVADFPAFTRSGSENANCFQSFQDVSEFAPSVV